MKIRLRQPIDDAEWLRLRCALWPDVNLDTHRGEMNAWLARADGAVLVAPRISGSKLAGFAEVGPRSVADGCQTSPVAYLEGWFVDVDMRRRGIGTALVRAAEEWARGQGFHEFASDADLSNVASQRAHEALGFTEVGRSVIYLKTL